jgi:aryl-alcohol dehydrogenase-like predicted oxidoreductase
MGRSGLKVSEICLGTMTFGNGADEDNIQAADFHLENEHLQRLNDISHLPDRSPEAMEKNRDEQRAEAVQIPGNR